MQASPKKEVIAVLLKEGRTDLANFVASAWESNAAWYDTKSIQIMLNRAAEKQGLQSWKGAEAILSTDKNNHKWILNTAKDTRRFKIKVKSVKGKDIHFAANMGTDLRYFLAAIFNALYGQKAELKAIPA